MSRYTDFFTTTSLTKQCYKSIQNSFDKIYDIMNIFRLQNIKLENTALYIVEVATVLADFLR